MNWARNIQDILLVTLITALIWLWAEGRNVQTYTPTAPVPVRVVLPAEDLVVLRQSPDRFRMEFKGAQSEINRLRRAISGTGITLEFDGAEPGEHNLVMSEQLAAAAPIAGMSVNITTVEPPTMQVEVDRLVRREVELAFTPPRDAELAEDSLSIEPERVTVTLPESRTVELGERLEVEAQQWHLQPGLRQRPRGRVQLPASLADDPHVQIEPREVQLAFTIERTEDAFILPSVPVWVTMPPADQENYIVRLDEESRVLRDVRISGPSDLVQRVRDGTLRVVATLRLSSDDLARAVDDSATGTVSFDLPPSLNVTAETQSVRYTVQRREE